MAQLVKHLALGFGSGFELVFCEIEPHVELCADSVEPSGILSLSLPLPHAHACTYPLSLSLSKIKKKKLLKKKVGKRAEE